MLVSRVDLSKSSQGGIFGTKKRSIKTEGFDSAHACPILRRKNTFRRLPGVIFGFPWVHFRDLGALYQNRRI